MEHKEELSRRNFLKNVGLAAGGVAVGASLGYAGSYTNKLICPYCDETFLSNDELNAHIIKTHSFETASSGTDWPWDVNYGKETEVVTDVLVIGGGLSGCHAAINAQKKGATVAVVDKAAVYGSGSGGAGIDHWYTCFKNPTINTDDKMLEMICNMGVEAGSIYGQSHGSYIGYKENWDALADLEEWGLQIRDTKDEFKGSAFRDEETKLMFAFNYDSKTTVRIPGGHKMKRVLHSELEKRKISIYDYTMVTSLLNENGKQGGRVIGATGLNTRTGEFFIFRAKAVILCTATPHRLWIFNTEQNGAASSFYDPNDTGEGHDIAFRAGAEFINMEYSHQGPATGGFTSVPYGVGNAQNTWYGCTIVDAAGKEVPYEDGQGNILTTVAERFKTPKDGGVGLEPAQIISDLGDRVKKGEFKLPLYADLPSMPEDERRAIWGIMVGNEGKTYEPVYKLYQRHGFDPTKDMLQVPVMPPNAYDGSVWWMGQCPPQWRECCHWSGTPIVDWSLKTSLDGLYAAGAFAGQGGASAGAGTGRYAGRQAAVYANSISLATVNRAQIDAEKERIYAPVLRTEGYGWKEVKAGLCRIMQDYCGQYRSKETLEMGLTWLASINDSEARKLVARNPHELARCVECYTHITVGRMMMSASLIRQCSSWKLMFQRIDFPDLDTEQWKKYFPIRLDGNTVKHREEVLGFWKTAPLSSSFEENYQKYCNL